MIITDFLEKNARLYGRETALVEIPDTVRSLSCNLVGINMTMDIDDFHRGPPECFLHYSTKIESCKRGGDFLSGGHLCVADTT